MTKTAGSAPTTGADPLTRMGALVRELAAPQYGGRRIGTTGGRRAATWLAGHLQDLGAGVEIDRFAASGAVREVYARPELVWGAGDTTGRLAFRRDFCEHLASADRPTVHHGRLARADQADVAGAWVLDGRFDPDRVAMLAAAGAAGVLVPRGTDEAGWMPKMIAGPAPAPLPVLAVRTELHDHMAAATASGLTWVTANMPIRTVDVIGANVHGHFRRPGGSGTTILLTAHFDGVGDDPDGTRFPAAADNASGVAVVVEAARQLHQRLPDAVGLAVALLDGEEVGALGSAHHAPRVDAGTQVINLDGVAALGEAAAVEAGGPAHALLAALDQAGRATGIALKAGAMPSDNRRYAAAGLASIGIGMGIPGYQTPAETVGRVDPSTLDAATRLVVATVEALVRGSASAG